MIEKSISAPVGFGVHAFKDRQLITVGKNVTNAAMYRMIAKEQK